MKLCFPWGPTKQCVGGMALPCSLFLAPVTVLEQLEQLLQKGPTDQSKKERASDVLFYLAFSTPRARQQQPIKQNSFPLN